MNNLFQNKFTRVIIPVFTIFFLSCQKNIDFITTDTQTPDLTTKVTSSVSGFVTDENDAAVMGAPVTVGGITTNTDKYGFFQVKNVQVVKTAAVVTVNRPGYFKGIKTYTAENNKAAFFRIKLIPKTNAGNISSTTGGSVTLSNGFIIALPANAVVNAATSVAYTGQVNVAAHWIDPTAADINQTMPGNLSGITTDGSLKTLISYGMAAVELTGASGELLQIAAGKKATLTFSIPSSILASAPATIPLWSFEETTGLWKQEGTATKTGNTYTGDVSHFSFWNCDIPADYVQFNCTLKDAVGNPLPYTLVKISVVGSGSAGYGWTDSSGYVGGIIPGNAQLLLEVLTSYNCGTPVYSQNFATTNINVSLGVITVTAAGTSIATISGTVTDCSNNPVTDGYIVMMEGWQYYRYALSNTGAFSFNAVLCNNTVAVTFIAEDNIGLQQSSPLVMTLTPGANAIGNLQACGVSTQEFVTYTINGGSPITFTAPADSVFQTGNGSTTSYYIGASSNGPSPNNGDSYFTFNTPGIGVGSVQTLTSFGCSQIIAQTTVNPPGNVNITEYGAVGEFVAGNFTCSLTDSAPPNTVYNVVCSFRVRRNF